MAFEMKYDRDGNPLKNPVLEQEIEQAPQVAPVESQQPIQEILQPESEIAVAEEAREEVVTQPQSKIDDKEQNLRNLREAAKRAERLEWERDEAFRRLREIEASRNTQQQTQQPAPVEEPDDLGLAETDLAEGKHLSKVARKIKELEKKVQQYEQKTATQVTETRLKSQFPDFDKVVNRDNILALQQQYPEIANTLNSSTDLYSTAVSAYTMIKKLGIVQEEVYNPERAQAIKNLAKPRPLASLSPQQGDSPLSKANAFANGLTEELKKQLQKEMFAARNNM